MSPLARRLNDLCRRREAGTPPRAPRLNPKSQTRAKIVALHPQK